MAKADLANRYLETARELRLAAEETREALQISRDLVEHSRQQTRAMIQSDYEQASGPECSDPSRPLVECLIQAYELAEAEGEPQTRALLGRVLMHVGHRIAVGLGPRLTKIIMH